MRALHSAERKGDLAPKGEKKLGRCGRRVISLLLCFCMTIPMLFSLGEFSPLSEEPTKPVNATKHVQNRVADPDTMDSYVGKLLSEDWGSRYAGRVWTDKSVFAYTADKENIITLDMETDGYDGTVGYGADFAHVFSALASSQGLTGVPPVRTVIVFDNSGSMYNSSKGAASNGEELWKKQRIGITIEAINRAIDILMEASIYNEVSVVLFGDGAQADRNDTDTTHVYHGNNTAVTILPMKHYTPQKPEGADENAYTPYLTGGWNNSSVENCFDGGTPCHQGNSADGKSDPNGGGWVFVNNVICDLNKTNHNSCGDLKYTGYANGTTNIQAGYYVGMQELLNADKTVNVGSDTYQCVPSLVMLTDGAATDKLSGTFITPEIDKETGYPTALGFVNDTGNKLRPFVGYDCVGKDGNNSYKPKDLPNFWDMFVEIVDGKYESVVKPGQYTEITSAATAKPIDEGLAAMKEVADTYSDSVASMLLGTLMTTAYYKAAVRKAYGIADGKNWDIYSLSVDMIDIKEVSPGAAQAAKNDPTNLDPKNELPTSWKYNITSNAPTMDPSEYFYKDGKFSLDWLLSRGYVDEGVDLNAALEDPSIIIGHTAYPNYSVGEMVIQGIFKAGKYLNQWSKDETLTTKYQSWQESKGILTKEADQKNNQIKSKWNYSQYTNPYSHGNGYLLENEETISWPQIASNDANKVTKQDVLDNIGYNSSAYYAKTTDDAAGNLAGTFQEIIDAITAPLFVPVAGQNAAGVGDSITYQDPLGEYMEIKNSSIFATPHHVDDPTIGTSGVQTYDMALLVFGEMHGLVRAGVYDYQWNNAWMEIHKGQKDPTNPDVLIEPDKTPFPQGWYKGSPEEAADAPLPEDQLKSNEAGTWPAMYETAQEARDDGWVMRFNFSTLLSFVPIAGAPTNGLPGGLSEQEKNTVYTCYRFAGSQEDRNELKRNPIFGEVPPELTETWNKYYETHKGSYPATNDLYANTSGVYRLSDIRVWVEETDDYVDTAGAITPNGGYDRSLYLNVPTEAVPTQLATITLGDNEVLAYLTNLATDKGIDYKAEGLSDEDKKKYEMYSYQSTPLRLFYAVGLEEDLILRDPTTDEQIGVDFTKISPEYIQAHGVVDEETGEQKNYIWFLSNYYSNTTYGDYVADMTTDARTRGDPTVTFSPSEDNRYYVFQRPLPLYAHAYRVQADGSLKAVDKSDTKDWNSDGSGNGATSWEGSIEGVVGGGSWSGGEFIGTYTNEEAFQAAYKNRETVGEEKYITDSHGNKYLYVENAVVFFEDDLLDHVTSNPDVEGEDGGYTKDSIPFSSDDYYFILLEYYLQTDGIGTNLKGETVKDSTRARKVQRVLARKGSEFGSGFVSQKIGNGDMLCWTDMHEHVTDAFKYFSKGDTGDLTRGEPTWEKLTYDGGELENYLTKTCGIKADFDMPNPDYDSNKPEDDSTNPKTVKALDYLVKYWTEIRENEQVKAALEAAKGGDATLTEDEFNAYFQFAVATRPGGIRTGDMSNNIQTKGEYNSTTQLYTENNTKTSNTYYLPTISEDSGTDDNVIINNYLGNNGRMEIANQMLHVTKTLEAPEGFALTDAAEREKFNYQLYVQGVSGKRSAILTEYNEYAGSWERQLAYIDVLTDNSDLVQDNNSTRALFIVDTFDGSAGDTMTAKQVIANGTDADGNPIYYEANEDGTLTFDKDGKVDTKANPMVDTSEKPLYYLYLPPIETTLGTTQHVRRLYQNVNYDGTADGYPEGTDFVKNGTTTYYSEGHRDDTGIESGSGNNTSFREATETRPAGTITYWAQDAELIPVTEVHAAEATNSIASGDPAAYALMAVGGGTTYETDAESSTPGVWTHGNDFDEEGKCTQSGHVNLTYDTFVIRKPSGETSMTAFESPFLTRTQYMTTELNFGVNANDDGSGEKGNPLTKNDLYDQIIPSADRPDLFGDVDFDGIAANTAEFTLRHGEGLLLSGLDNRVVYRFTEKLTDEQMKKGYTLKQISHVQQRGSDTVYMPGVQEIPVYKNSDGTITWAIGSDGEENSAAQKGFEPFAHTNAILWESYATMAAGASGNHHQPEEGEPAKNPSCEDAGDKANLDVGRCDLAQTDGTTRHYFYYGGKLVDPHYEGEAAGMSRYVLNPTAHFGLTDETVFGTNPDNGYYEYNGVYSVYGTTGWFEEQVHYTNTVSPEMLVLTKQIVDKAGKPVENPPEKEFTFTLTLFTSDKAALYDSDGRLYYWKGLISNLGKSPEEGGPPCLDKFQEYIPTDPEEPGKTYLTPLEVTTKGTGDVFGEYTVTFKANETVVIYGLVSGMGYTVEETPDDQYPAVGGEAHTETGEGYFTQSGTVVHDLSEAKSMFPKATSNRTDFYNQLPDGELTIGKKILDSDAETVTQKFTFEVTLTPLDSDEGLTATKYDKNGEKVDGFTLKWDNTTDGGKVATFELQHGETVVIGGIPLGTKYTVKETKRDGYNLQHVADNKEDKPDEDEKYLELTNGGIEGTVTADKPRAFLLFANGKAVAPPFTGGLGAGEIVLGGVLLIGLSVALFLYGRHRKRRVI